MSCWPKLIELVRLTEEAVEAAQVGHYFISAHYTTTQQCEEKNLKQVEEQVLSRVKNRQTNG